MAIQDQRQVRQDLLPLHQLAIHAGDLCDHTVRVVSLGCLARLCQVLCRQQGWEYKCGYYV